MAGDGEGGGVAGGRVDMMGITSEAADGCIGIEGNCCAQATVIRFWFDWALKGLTARSASSKGGPRTDSGKRLFCNRLNVDG